MNASIESNQFWSVARLSARLKSTFVFNIHPDFRRSSNSASSRSTSIDLNDEPWTSHLWLSNSEFLKAISSVRDLTEISTKWQRSRWNSIRFQRFEKTESSSWSSFSLTGIERVLVEKSSSWKQNSEAWRQERKNKLQSAENLVTAGFWPNLSLY